MLALNVIFNNFLSAFPTFAAKDATGAGSTDGSEYKKTVVDELWLGWIQRVLVKVGQTPNAVPETSSVSQIFDAMREAFNTPEEQVVNSSGAVTLGKTNHKIEFDASVGNISPDLPVPDFIGQQLFVYTTGSGIVDIGGAGLYTNRVFQTLNTGILRIVAISLTEWRAENGVSADYVSGSITVNQSTNGLMESFQGSVAMTGFNISGPNYKTLTFPVAFQSTPAITHGVYRASDASDITSRQGASSNTGFDLGHTASVGTAVTGSFISKGTY